VNNSPVAMSSLHGEVELSKFIVRLIFA